MLKRNQFLSAMMAIIFVFALTGTAFAFEPTKITGTSAAMQQTEECTEVSPETSGEEEVPEIDPEANWTLQVIGEQVARIRKGQTYNDPGVVLLDEEGNVQYICLPDKVGVTVLDQMGNRHRDLEADFLMIGTIANQYEGGYALVYSFRGKITFREVQVSKDLKELPEGKNAPAESLEYSLKLRGNYELTVKKGEELKGDGVQVYDQFWREHKNLEKDVTKTTLDMEKLGYQVLQYELNGRPIIQLVRVVEQSTRLILKFSDKNVSQNKMRVTVGSEVTLPTVKVLNIYGKEQQGLEESVVVRGNFDENKEGTYTLVYDLDGFQVTLTVNVDKAYRTTSSSSGSSYSSSSSSSSSGGGSSSSSGSSSGGTGSTTPPSTEPEEEEAPPSRGTQTGQGDGGQVKSSDSTGD